ncbi:hypothetical protein, partial [Pantoea septica]
MLTINHNKFAALTSNSMNNSSSVLEQVIER